MAQCSRRYNRFFSLPMVPWFLLLRIRNMTTIYLKKNKKTSLVQNKCSHWIFLRNRCITFFALFISGKVHIQCSNSWHKFFCWFVFILIKKFAYIWIQPVTWQIYPLEIIMIHVSNTQFARRIIWFPNSKIHECHVLTWGTDPSDSFISIELVTSKKIYFACK